jgi:hypothetical protein
MKQLPSSLLVVGVLVLWLGPATAVRAEEKFGKITRLNPAAMTFDFQCSDSTEKWQNAHVEDSKLFESCKKWHANNTELTVEFHGNRSKSTVKSIRPK